MGKKRTIWVSNQVRYKPGCTAAQNSQKPEISDLEGRGITLSVERKTKALISCAVTAQLICAFGFAYADCLLSDVAALIRDVHPRRPLEKSHVIENIILHIRARILQFRSLLYLSLYSI